MLVGLGVEWWPEPMENPTEGDIAVYDIDAATLTRWRVARSAYLAARAALVGQLEQQGWRAIPPDRDDGPSTDTTAR